VIEKFCEKRADWQSDQVSSRRGERREQKENNQQGKEKDATEKFR
jgi:hypothetical protein